ncbi:ImuA family protein [Sphingopyxis sp. MWB1]|uniref:ImuA family protein n=1 Tax=Sphingopyxis sp. MWB1 TaxID=1537715 RepID=UPI001F19958A|nr:hypothetical protein [Sphingopyxis sp. MWB1]
MQGKSVSIEAQDGACHSTALGHSTLDIAIGGGLARGRLHELFAAERADSSSAAGFTAMLACLVNQGRAPLFWLREDMAERQARLYPPGLAEIGIDPERIVLVALPDPVTLLRTAVDVARCASVGVAVIEVWRSPRALDLTASRRLALAAKASGVTILLLRVEAEPGPSAAQTRWSVHAAPSTALEAGAPGRPSFIIKLLRQRGRPDGGTWHLEWDRDRSSFRDTTLSGSMVSVSLGRSLARGAPLRTG